MFRHRRQLHRWAVHVLFVWLFGIAAGIAHACLTPNPVTLGAQRSAPAVEAVHGGAAASASELHLGSRQSQPEGAPGHEGSPGKSNCLDFCDKAAVLIPPSKFALDNVHGHALPPPAVAMTRPVADSSPDQPLPPRRDGHLAPPITIAFLRLAL
ncbi:MAG: hypothetical protein Q8N44_20545 [Rubrivivax sp.]|nr:hypothetical protein [Rubrivivax sp.]MDP3086066.1 hypothetical protein [Rubrivivax sp.]